MTDKPRAFATCSPKLSNANALGANKKIKIIGTITRSINQMTDDQPF